MRKGIFFTLDSVFGLLILITLYGVFTLVSIETVSAEILHENLHMYAEDMVDVMSKMRLWDARHEPTVLEVCNTSAFDSSDINKTVIDAVGALWATNESANMVLAAELLEVLFKNAPPKNINWALQIKREAGYETAYNTSYFAQGRYMSAVSRRLLSGYMKGRPMMGFASKAYLSNVIGIAEAEYIFFGGFVGQGNLTVYLREIPADASIKDMYLEMALGNNFTLYVNDTSCGQFNKTPGQYSVNNWTITEPCISNIQKGVPTRIDINFSGNISLGYVGGGFIKVRYETSTSAPFPTGVTRYYFPGIDGLVNLYDSFFVPGNITSISGRIHVLSNYSMFLGIGNQTPVAFNGSETEQTVLLTDVNFSGVNYSDISLTTVPLRFGSPNMTLLLDASAGDIALVNDVSGSMEWCADQDNACCNTGCPTGSNCSCGTGDCGQENRTFINPADGLEYCGYRWFSDCTPPTEKKIGIAINASNEFLNIVLSNPNNRVGIVEYSGPGQAKRIGPDFWIPAQTTNPPGITITPWTTPQGQNVTYNITATVYNLGLDRHSPFNVSFYNASIITQCNSDANNIPGNLIGTVEVPELNYSKSVNVSVNWTANLSCPPPGSNCKIPITVYADPENVVSELDECNHKKSVNISVGAPNLYTVWDSMRQYHTSWHGVTTYSTGSNICRNMTNMTVNFTIDELEGIAVDRAEIMLIFNYTDIYGNNKSIVASYFNDSFAPYQGKLYQITVPAWVMDTIGDEKNWSGSVNAYAIADPLNEVLETDEGDNDEWMPLGLGKPDLYPYAFYPNPTGLCNETPRNITLTALISNTGGCPVFDPFIATVYVDSIDPTNASGNMIGIFNASWLNESNLTYWGGYSNDYYSVGYEANITENTTFYIWVDYPPVPNGTVYEGDESNNIGVTSIEVLEAPDLDITEFLVYNGNITTPWDPGHTFDGGMEQSKRWAICFGEDVPLQWRVAVYNRGCPVTDNFTLSMYTTTPDHSAPLTQIQSALVNGLDQGQTQYIMFPYYTFNLMQNTRVTAWADHPPAPNGVIAEEYEDNNNATRVLHERTSNLNITDMHTVLPWACDPCCQHPTSDPPYEYLFTCREPGNYVLGMNITNEGPCNVYGDFNASFNYRGIWDDYMTEIYRQVIHGINRSQTIELSYVWDGERPDKPGEYVWEVGDYGAHVVGVVDHSPNSTGNIPYPPEPYMPAPFPSEGSIYEGWDYNMDWEYDNYFLSKYEYESADIYVSNMSAGKIGDGLFEINATIRNKDSICRTPSPFDVVLFNPFTGDADEFNYTTISNIMNPGDEVNLTMTWSASLFPDTVYWIYGWANFRGGGHSGFSEYDTCTGFWCCNSIETCPNNLNRTALSYTSGGSGAPFINSLMQLLMSPGNTIPLTSLSYELGSKSAVQESKPQKDGELTVTEFSVSPSQAVCGSHGKYWLNAKVTNTGEAPASGSVSFDSQVGAIGSRNVPVLKPGESAEISMKWSGILYNDTLFTASTGASAASFVVKDPPCPPGTWTDLSVDSINRVHPLSDNITSLGWFVNDSETWYETCICCGILNATDMLANNGDPTRLRSMVIMSDGIANVGCAGMGYNLTGDPINDTIQAACNAYNNYSIAVYTVGFGADVDENTLNLTAECGHGAYFNATDTEDLIDAYREVASELLKLNYKDQVLEAEGVNRSTLYPDSYLEFTYTPRLTPLGYRDFVVTVETNNFSTCTGSFSVSESLTPFDVKVTSYSADRWTNEITFANGTPSYGTEWVVFNLSKFGNRYSLLGDPFVVEFDPTVPMGSGAEYPGIIQTGPLTTNYVNVSTGSGPGNYSTLCPNRNRVIYKAIVSGSVPFTPVLPTIVGRNVTVYYDLYGDENIGGADGYIQVPIGMDIPGVPFDPTPVNMTDIMAEQETNALADAFLRLMDRLNYWQLPHRNPFQSPPCTQMANCIKTNPFTGQCVEPNATTVNDACCLIESLGFGNCCYGQPPGSECNAIDVKITPEIVMKSIAINEIPYMYGPVDIGVVTWIE